MTDVCLILEGTYPFVAGGVARWIHQLVSAMGDLRFSILYISAAPQPSREYKYPVPSNVVDIQDLYLQDYSVREPLLSARRRREAFEELRGLHERLFQGRVQDFSRLAAALRAPGAVTTRDIFQSRESWEALLYFYERHARGVSFLDFFWTWRSMYVPILQSLRAPLPKARLYHTVSTGYAGLIASVAKETEGRKMLLTEHGIYTHERFLEISQAHWIYSTQKEPFRIERGLPFFKRLWYGLFETMSKVAYHHADHIVTLYEGNRTREILAGADPAKISVIPNGIDLDFFSALGAGRKRGKPFSVVFIGRVVAIKDVKTFLRACKIVLAKDPEARFSVIGPEEEEPPYALECRQMASELGLDKALEFKGSLTPKACYEAADVVVLTSLSEAQPYVIIEANAAGIPVVATDVGACREMLEGRLPEDRQLGASGCVTPVSSPEETAQAILDLARDEDLWMRRAQAGRQRALRFYDQKDLLGKYLNLYEQNMS